MNYLKIYKDRIGCSIDELVRYIEGAVNGAINNYTITSRVKDAHSLQKKLLFKNTKDIFLLKDIYGIRILVDEVEDVYKMLHLISQKVFGYIKNDYITSPKTRDEVIHLKGKKIRFIQYIAVRNNTLYEIQITTKEFHRLNEELHSGYKENKYS